MVILLGVARRISAASLSSGEIVLLFQPAEERGEGALKVLKDPKFRGIQPDYVFALHNLPGFPMGRIVIREKEFASASVGMEIKLFGKTSHAGEPDKGVNPSTAVAGIIENFNNLGQNQKFQATAFITIVHVLLGEIAYGTSAGYAEVRATLRAHRNPDMRKLGDVAHRLVEEIAAKENLKSSIRMVEDFPAAVNHSSCVRIVEESAHQAGLEITRISEPFSWSEDFSQFLLRYPGCLFGLGSGENHPKLHNPDYDFPDEIISPGIDIFWNILSRILEIEP
jgi:amidohydrolase